MLNKKVKNIDQENFNLLKKMGKRNDSLLGLKCRELYYLPYGFVKIDLIDYIEDKDFEKLIYLSFEGKLDKDKISKLSLKEAMEFVLWLTDSLAMIIQNEKANLSSMPDIDLVNAGVNRLDILGEANLIDSLAGGDILKWEKVKKIPYHRVFDKQLKSKIENDIQRDLSKIQRDKSKQKR